MKVILCTGGLGFIGKHFIDFCFSSNYFIINVDKGSYASDWKWHEQTEMTRSMGRSSVYKLIQKDISELDYLPECDAIVNFAAESHVDNSLTNNRKFCDSNIIGVHRLLELIREKEPGARPKLVQISTDEVYGDIKEGSFDETSILKPSNPYSATKAAADNLITAWGRTYDINYNIVRMTNVYGQHQFPEKLIPRTCLRFSKGFPAIIHGDGSYVRTWLHTSDAIRAIYRIMESSASKEIFNICGNIEISNLDVVKKLAKLYFPEENPDNYIKFVDNRVSQDIRYSLNDIKIRNTLGWQPLADFDKEIDLIVKTFDEKRFL